MDKYLFDDLGSVWHAVLGFITAFFLPLAVALAVILIFTVYEVREPEDPVATVGDVVEFMVGFDAGLLAKVSGGWW